MTLREFFTQHKKVALGFSGGVDSSYLLYAAIQNNADIMPYFVKTPFQPTFELEDAERLTGELKCGFKALALDNLADVNIAENGADRCYHCKKKIFMAIKNQAVADGYKVFIDGSNASDDVGDRHGTYKRSMNGLKGCALLKTLAKSNICVMLPHTIIFI